MPTSDAARTLVVTGASSGIGAELAIQGARAGFRLVIVARRAERLAAVAESVRNAGGSVVALTADVTARDTPARIVDAATREYGRIDVLVNNAGRGTYGDLLDQNDAELAAQWQLNVEAPIRIARAALPHVEAVRGQFVFVGSGIARVPIPGYGAYSAAKAAIRAAAVQLRRELRRRGIAVTYVDPGLVASEFHQASGMERAADVPAAAPARVAAAILRGIERRSAVVNAVGWQTFGSALAEWSGTLADPIVIARFAPKPLPREAVVEAPQAEPQPEPVAGTFETALEPLARRMERVNLTTQFVRDALAPGSTLELNALAMQWTGMPNKNERAALREVLEALQAAGFVEPLPGERWTVVRAAD